MTNTVQFRLCDVLRVVTFIKTENRMVLPGAGEMGELLFNKNRDLVLQDDKLSRDGLCNSVSMLHTTTFSLYSGSGGKFYVMCIVFIFYF